MEFAGRRTRSPVLGVKAAKFLRDRAIRAWQTDA
jgi:hypothetical protein